MKVIWSHYDYLVWPPAWHTERHLIIPASNPSCFVELHTFLRKKATSAWTYRCQKWQWTSASLRKLFKWLMTSLLNTGTSTKWEGSSFLLCLLKGRQPVTNDLVHPYWSHYTFLVYSNLGRIMCVQRQHEARGGWMDKWSLSSGWCPPFVTVCKPKTSKDQEKVKWLTPFSHVLTVIILYST